MKKVYGSLLGLMALSSFSALYGEYDGKRLYIEPKGAMVWHHKTQTNTDNTKTKPGFGAGMAIGYAFENNWRAEIEGGYTRNKLKSNTYLNDSDVLVTEAATGRLEHKSVLVNALYDYALGETAFSLYAGAGLGYSHISFKSGSVRDSGNMAAYQLMAGVSYAVNEKWTLSCGYKFFSSFNKPKLKTRNDPNTEPLRIKRPMSHSLVFGVRYMAM